MYWNVYSSPTRKMKYGVLQGPILWPLLFLQYRPINDLPLNIQGENLVLFADDTSLIKFSRASDRARWLKCE